MNDFHKTVVVAETRTVIDTRDAISRRAKAEYALKIAREKLDGAMGKDMTWRKLKIQRTRLTIRTKSAKERLLKDPKILDLADFVDDARQAVKDTSEQLSLFLDRYVDETKQKVITDSSGTMLNIIRDNRLKKGKKS